MLGLRTLVIAVPDLATPKEVVMILLVCNLSTVQICYSERLFAAGNLFNLFKSSKNHRLKDNTNLLLITSNRIW